MWVNLLSNKIKLEIETSHATRIANPVYSVDGIMHYVVDHTPTIFWKTATESISKEIIKFQKRQV